MRDCFTSVSTVLNKATGKTETVTVTCSETIEHLKSVITQLTGRASTDNHSFPPPDLSGKRLICGEFFLFEVQYYDLDGNTSRNLETGICDLNRDHPRENPHRTARGAPAIPPRIIPKPPESDQ